MKKGNRGFTLIELLVVIAIIAILAAILFPVFTQARAKARQISCLSNVKNLSLAVLMYVDDNDGKFPLNGSGIFTNLTGYGGSTWSPLYHHAFQFPNSIASYIGAPEILHCPADGGTSSNGNGSLLSYWAEGEDCYLMTYEESYYAQSTVDVGGVFGCFGIPESKIPEPGNTAMLCCEPMNLNNPDVASTKNITAVNLIRTVSLNSRYGFMPGCFYSLICPGTDTELVGKVKHNGGSNLGFADGHAKWMKVPKMFYPKNLFARHTDAVGWDPYGLLTYYGYKAPSW